MEAESIRRAKGEVESQLELARGEIEMLRRAKGDMERVVEAATHNAEVNETTPPTPPT